MAEVSLLACRSYDSNWDQIRAFDWDTLCVCVCAPVQGCQVGPFVGNLLVTLKWQRLTSSKLHQQPQFYFFYFTILPFLLLLFIWTPCMLACVLGARSGVVHSFLSLPPSPPLTAISQKFHANFLLITNMCARRRFERRRRRRKNGFFSPPSPLPSFSQIRN